jgi:hypothetical protein
MYTRARTTRRRQNVSAALCLVLLLTGLGGAPAAADEERLWLTVVRPFAEMHTGPGRGYPVFHIVERGEAFTLLRQRTEWFQVETLDGKHGWMHRVTVEGSEGPDGQLVRFGRAGQDAWRDRRFELGFAAGDFDGDPLFSFRAGYRLGPHFVAEAQLLQAAGSFSSTTIYHANLQVLPFLDGRIVPFFSLGAGRITNEPKSTLVDAAKVQEWSGNVGLGARAWLTRRFLLRGDVRHFVLTRDVNNNDDFTEFSVGVSVFF